MVSETGSRLLDETRQELLKMARLVQNIFHKTASALLERNMHSARDAISLSSSAQHSVMVINKRVTVVLGVVCMRGKSLRFFASAMSITKVLKLISERSAELSETALTLAKMTPFGFHENLRYTLNTVGIVLREAIDNLITPSLVDVERICRTDNELGKRFGQIEKEIVEAMNTSSALVEKGILLIAVFRSLKDVSELCMDLIELAAYIDTGRNYVCTAATFVSADQKKD